MHRYHLHGFHVHIIGYNYTEIPFQQNPNFNEETQQLIYDPVLYNIPDLDQRAAATVADSFTIPYPLRLLIGGVKDRQR
eukprot:COSAG05_NODE_128_length_17216_cov_2576.721038_3_plen_79_part_00